jgi:hypothetical protein
VIKEGARALKAHAWVVCGERIVLGESESDRYAPLLAWERT